ncbi:MoaD/ThiS family protein [Helicobacter kayseriensis]|uniref:MoaD/ThiS family protein n=1 Tax=Helicobacter kayseriensis TaxID=2905877 RepID=UPI001E37A0A6|nr:MoaD/ThiS family protein [Helicobacter kayseriensis]MCE3046799.1 MoaD/ThiS family protein [Helicobacter kayseriensis]MCE3047899.1 MoaD/ThiS family protein [Helicobacter kayseriensis]
MAKIKVEFLGPIGLEAQSFELSTLEELKNELQKDIKLQEWLKLSAVAINNVIVENLDYSFQDGDHVVLLPPVCGG